MLVYPDHPHPVEACLIVDEKSVSFCQDRIIGGVPGHAQARDDMRDTQMVNANRCQCPPLLPRASHYVTPIVA